MITDVIQSKMSLIDDSIMRSNLTCIGYTSGKGERMMNLFLSKFNPYKINNITSPFSLHPYIRDVKIGLILGEGDRNIKFNTFILIDVHDIDTVITDTISRSKMIRRICENLRSDSFKFGYKVIMTSSVYRTIEPEKELTLYGGTSLIYASDLVIVFTDTGIKISKSRYNIIVDDFLISYEELQIFRTFELC